MDGGRAVAVALHRERVHLRQSPLPGLLLSLLMLIFGGMLMLPEPYSPALEALKELQDVRSIGPLIDALHFAPQQKAESHPSFAHRPFAEGTRE